MRKNVILICRWLWSKGWTTWIWWRDENRLFQMRLCLILNWTGNMWYSSMKWYLYSNGFVVLSEKTLNMASRIIQILFKMGCCEVLKNIKCYFWWRSIWIESFERKCIRSYALNWGYFSVWCDGNLGDKRSDKMFQLNRIVFCFVFVYGN